MRETATITGIASAVAHTRAFARPDLIRDVSRRAKPEYTAMEAAT
jgi:hypothetical protein